MGWHLLYQQFKKFFILGAFITSLLFSAVLVGGLELWYHRPQKNQETVVNIPKGTSLSQIVALLSSKELINAPTLLKGILYTTGQWKKLKAGEYRIPEQITPAQLIAILKSGKVVLHPVTLTEGETSYHLVKKLRENSHFEGTCEIPLEGTMLPETYRFPRGTKRQLIIDRMQKAMNAVVSEVWEVCPSDHPLTTSEELIILASIVERETSMPAEKPIVAAVFLNRLKQGMPLQADPTVLYGLFLRNAEVKKSLSREDLRVETPYNTYLCEGLPPTPISNPSVSALKAVIRPADVPYIYFVADGSGGHVFSTTLDEHQKHHAAWRKIRDGKGK